MKKNKILFMLFIFFFYSFSQALSQNSPQTPYQKKKLELAIKWYKILSGKPVSMLNEVLLNQQLQSDEDQGSLLSLAALDYASKHSKSQCDKVFTQIKTELKQAEKLKTSVDFQREKEAKERKLKFEKEKKMQVEQVAKEKKIQAEKDAFERTDVGSIQYNIKSAFDIWNQKGEFEKEEVYNTRLRTQSQKEFDKICFKQIQNKINSFNKDYWVNEISTYNSEGEFFIVTFKINNVEWKSKINIPITQAQNFKSNWSDLYVKIDYYKWCCIDNNLCPTLITLINNHDENTKYDFPLSLKNQSEITYSFDNLQIDNQYLKGYIFKYSNSQAIKEQIENEKYRLDSLERSIYNQKLDSIFNHYNRQLLKNPYNISQKLMTDCKKITDKNDYETKFETIVSTIVNNFNELNTNFEKKLKSTNPKEYFHIYYNQNPNIKAIADKKYIECKCLYTNRIDFDIKFQYGIAGHCLCQSDEYDKNGYLFKNREEFDSFYVEGDEVYMQEVEKRSKLKNLSVRSKKSEINNEKDEVYKNEDNKRSDLNYLSSNSKFIESIDFQNIKNKSVDETIQKILSIIIDSKNKSYYNEILDFVINTNKGLKNEWINKGELFYNKIEFYEAYTSGSYEKLLKEKK